MATKEKQIQLVELFQAWVDSIAAGYYGRGNDIDGVTLEQALTNMLENDVPAITGYGT